MTVSRETLRRRDAGGVFLGVLVLYLIAFLYSIQNLAFRTSAGFDLTLARDPLSTVLQPAPGTFMFQPAALVEFGIVVVEVSPINIGVGLVIATLVGVNLALSYRAIVQPASCGMTPSTGVLAGIPALLAGSACCAPVVFLVVGIQVTGTLMTAFAWLLPASVLLLLGTMVYVAGNVTQATV